MCAAQLNVGLPEYLRLSVPLFLPSLNVAAFVIPSLFHWCIYPGPLYVYMWPSSTWGFRGYSRLLVTEEKTCREDREYVGKHE